MFKKKLKNKHEINFSSIFYLTQYIKNIILKYNQYKIMNEIFYIFVFYTVPNLHIQYISDQTTLISRAHQLHLANDCHVGQAPEYKQLQSILTATVDHG